jgi:hypothetical protein
MIVVDVERAWLASLGNVLGFGANCTNASLRLKHPFVKFQTDFVTTLATPPFPSLATSLFRK